MYLMAAFVPHRSNKYFHVIASNGIVSSSPYIMDCISNRIGSGIRNCPRRRCRRATFGALPTLSVRDRAIIVLNDHRFWGYASGPSSSGNTLPSSIHSWHGHAARRSALPRERFSPLALFGQGPMSDLSPLSGEGRKLDFEAVSSPFDRYCSLIPGLNLRRS
jgi:hypothetical protein